MGNTLVQLGQQGFTGGAIADQTLLLQDIRDGLGVYNSMSDPVIEKYTEQTTRQVLRVSQAPKKFDVYADGGNINSSKMVYRLLTAPLINYALNSEFTQLWLQDALSSDVMNEMEGALKGDVELVNSLFFQAALIKQTAGNVGVAYQAGFYNGETDVPAFKTNTFSSAHYHYLGLNHTTFVLADLRAMAQDIREHGYGTAPGSLTLFAHSAQEADIMALANSNSTILQAITPQRQKAIDEGIRNTSYVIEGINIMIDDNMPTGYLFMVADDEKPMIRREHLLPQFQGLQTWWEAIVPDFPLAGMKFLRRLGFAVQKLGMGTCRQLVGSATYTNPTFRLG